MPSFKDMASRLTDAMSNIAVNGEVSPPSSPRISPQTLNLAAAVAYKRGDKKTYWIIRNLQHGGVDPVGWPDQHRAEWNQMNGVGYGNPAPSGDPTPF